MQIRRGWPRAARCFTGHTLATAISHAERATEARSGYNENYEGERKVAQGCGARERARVFQSGSAYHGWPIRQPPHFPLSSTGSLRHDHARTALADGNGHVCGTSQGPRRRGCKRQAASGRRQGSRLALPAHPPSRHLALGARVDFCDWSAVRPISGVEHAALCISGARQPPLLADPRAHPSQHRPSPAVGS